jgi:XRE family aerobic/anaerobic benzoate catabolism transcriptional regulator
VKAKLASVNEPRVAEVGDRLRAARAKAGMTRRQLAAASGTSERYLAQLEAGTGNPSVTVLVSLAAALDMAVAELLPQGGERSEAHANFASSLRRLTAEQLALFDDWLKRQGGGHAKKAARIVLIGMRGAGKSSLGAALARRLEMPFLELSTEVERSYGGEMGLLIELGGQSALRRYEREAWERIKGRYDAAVIAASGGIVADGPLYDEVLSTAHSIWLQATPKDHMSRVIAQGDFRPMASNRNAMADLKAILEVRASDYERTDSAVNTSAQDFERTLDLLERTTRDLLRQGT